MYESHRQVVGSRIMPNFSSVFSLLLLDRKSKYLIFSIAESFVAECSNVTTHDDSQVVFLIEKHVISVLVRTLRRWWHQ